MDYTTLRALHITCVLLSLAGFVLRGVLHWRQSPWCQRRLFKTLPHVNDTFLLGAGVALATWSGQTPWQQPWLGVKLLALLGYIGLGMIAFRPDRPRQQRVAAWLGAVVLYVWMLSVAHWRHPAGVFVLLDHWPS